jgi:diguanylate cyclase (GGDEF)-like protein
VRRHSLTTTFALVSVAAMATLGVALVAVNDRLLADHALTEASQTAQAYVSTGVEPRVTAAMFRAPGQIDAQQAAQLDALFRGGSAHATVRLWTAQRNQFYDSGRTAIVANSVGAGQIPDDARFAAALAPGGSAQPKVTLERTDHGVANRRIDVYVPLYVGRGGSPVGIAEVVLPYEQTADAVARATRSILMVVAGGLALLWLLLLDIDRFKEVNDTLGHPRGDALLLQVAERLSAVVRDSDTVSRLGGDEFAVLLPQIASLEAAEQSMERIQSVFDDPFDLDGLVLHVDTSIGLAVLPDHADDVTDLLARADVAMYSAKAAGAGMAVYSSAGDANTTSRLTLLGELRRALDTDELQLYYQPKISLKTGRVTGLEALLRWNHPTRGLVPPTEFIPIAEQTGLMHQLTRRVLGLVGEQMADWDRDGVLLPVAVNLSARNLLEPDLDRVVAAMLDLHGLPASMMEFEITESALIEDPARAAEMLGKLTALGITVAVDDFGIGNTAMGQLRTMPLRTIKIDRSFVTNLGSDGSHGVLVRAIVDLAHEFGLVAVAEGVEDEEAIRQLVAMGCDLAQGFHWSRPVPADELPAVLLRLGEQADAASAAKSRRPPRARGKQPPVRS